MRGIILSALISVLAVASMAMPAAATSSSYSSNYSGSNHYSKNGNTFASSAAVSGAKHSVLNQENGRYSFALEGKFCMTFFIGINSDRDSSQTCDSNDIINNPPKDSTVTIDGLCDGDAAKLKSHIKGDNVKLIINSTGPCEDDNNNGGTVPVKVVVIPDSPQPNASYASVNTNPKAGGAAAELPQTGTNEVIASVVATVLAVSAYVGTMAVRAFRARA